MKKRILYIWKDAYPWDVRTEKFCKSLVNNGFDVLLLCRWRGKFEQEEDMDGYHISRVGYKKNIKTTLPVPFNPVWYYAIKKHIKQYKPDLIIIREYFFAIPAGILARKFNIPVIMDMAEHYPAAMLDWHQYNKNFIVRFLVQNLKVPFYIEKKGVPLMDGIITVCDEQNARLKRDYNYPDEKMCVVHNTPPLDWFKNVRLGASIPPKIFAYHGFLTEVRNIDHLVKGFILAVQKDSSIKLEIYGSGIVLPILQDLANNSSVASRIFFAGEYDHSQIDELYSRMDVGILPYRANLFINTTISNKLFDYMACGKPVIVTPAIPMIRVVKSNECGVVTENESPEAIAEAILNISKMDIRTMGNNAIKAAREQYNWEVDTKHMLEFFRKYLL